MSNENNGMAQSRPMDDEKLASLTGEMSDSGTGSVQTNAISGQDNVDPEEKSISVSITPEDMPKDTSDLIGGKFKSNEDLLKAYQELEKRQSLKPAQEEAPQEEAPKFENQSSAIDFYSKKFTEQGESFSEEDYAGLAEAGFNRKTVDAYINGQRAMADDLKTETLNVVGGQDKFDSMAEWARANLPESQIQLINQQLGDPSLMKMGVTTLKALYEQSNGFEPTNRIVGSGRSGGDTQDVFNNQRELAEAMRHSEYNLGGAYTKAIEAKIIRSLKAGTL